MSPNSEPHLKRRFGLWQATALNMTNMIGVGPFITIPALMSTINGGGPQCMLGWLAALIIVGADGLVWAELGAAMPASGGSYLWLREGFGREKWGRLMAFLFIWQFIISGPMEIGTGFIGLKQYLGFFLGQAPPVVVKLIIVGLGALLLALLYRRIVSVGRITMLLWAGTLLTVGAVILSGIGHFDPKVAFSTPPRAFAFSMGFVMGLGAAASIGVYDYLGYYDICYIGEEAVEPGKTIPRSILLSLGGVAVIYLTMNLSIIGVVPWRTFVPVPDSGPAPIASIFMERVWGAKVAWGFTFMILWTAFGSVFTLLLGYSRAPYAAARDGYFFKVFARLHPTKDFPHVSLVFVTVLSVAFSFVDLSTLINALLTTRIVVQFIGQIGALIILRRTQPKMPRPFRMWLYPLPALVALGGWIFLFVTTERKLQVGCVLALAVGTVCFLLWSWRGRAWPFAKSEAKAVVMAPEKLSE